MPTEGQLWPRGMIEEAGAGGAGPVLDVDFTSAADLSDFEAPDAAWSKNTDLSDFGLVSGAGGGLQNEAAAGTERIIVAPVALVDSLQVIDLSLPDGGSTSDYNYLASRFQDDGSAFQINYLWGSGVLYWRTRIMDDYSPGGVEQQQTGSGASGLDKMTAMIATLGDTMIATLIRGAARAALDLDFDTGNTAHALRTSVGGTSSNFHAGVDAGVAGDCAISLKHPAKTTPYRIQRWQIFDLGG